MDELEFKRAELNKLINNLSLSCETVVRKSREFEELANKVYGVKDGSYWMQRSRRLEKLLMEITEFCPAGYRDEIQSVLGEMFPHTMHVDSLSAIEESLI